MRVLHVAAECHPLAKTGGLGDVVGALPRALAAAGVDARVLLPAYPGVRDGLGAEAREVVGRDDLHGHPARLLAGTAATGLRVLALDVPRLFDRPSGGPYQAGDGRDWEDNHLRFGALCRAAATVAVDGVPGWRPDLVHVHDWHAGLTPALLRLGARDAPPTVLTVHNLAYPGLFPPEAAVALGLSEDHLAGAGPDHDGGLGFLEAGLVHADHVTTVSPTYAREILSPDGGMGFDALLRARSAGGRLTGILNGIGPEWDPGHDEHLPVDARYSASSVERKAVSRARLQVELGLAADPGPLLLGTVSRLTPQKGLDLLLDALPTLLDTAPAPPTAPGVQVAVLGRGDADLERRLTDAARSRPGRMAVRVDVDERLAHLLQAGADAVLVPSRFEPCGLTQLCGLRYGTLPVVAGVGGLADTVVDATPAARADGTATGFVFAPGSVPGLLDAVRRAMALRACGSDWRRVQHRAMTRDVGWGPSARAYALLYADVVSGARRPAGCGSDGADRGDGTEPAPCPERYRQAPSASSGRDRW